MAESSTIARPYAEAVFKLADGARKLDDWSAMLAALAEVASNDRVRAATADPGLSAGKAAGLYSSILAGKLTAECENFLRVLAENRRLALLPEIRNQYEVLKDEREGKVNVDIQTAFALDAAQLADLVAHLEKSTGRKIKTRISVDKELIGGVRVSIGDKVIDASARAQLAALESALKA
jgi:F-type H+-transporting ATPase subunit delta